MILPLKKYLFLRRPNLDLTKKNEVLSAKNYIDGKLDFDQNIACDKDLAL